MADDAYIAELGPVEPRCRHAARRDRDDVQPGVGGQPQRAGPRIERAAANLAARVHCPGQRVGVVDRNGTDSVAADQPHPRAERVDRHRNGVLEGRLDHHRSLERAFAREAPERSIARDPHALIERDGDRACLAGQRVTTAQAAGVVEAREQVSGRHHPCGVVERVDRKKPAGAITQRGNVDPQRCGVAACGNHELPLAQRPNAAGARSSQRRDARRGNARNHATGTRVDLAQPEIVRQPQRGADGVARHPGQQQHACHAAGDRTPVALRCGCRRAGHHSHSGDELTTSRSGFESPVFPPSLNDAHSEWMPAASVVVRTAAPPLGNATPR